MRLVFIHGWGFDPHIWDAVAACFPNMPQARVDLGFFGPRDLGFFGPRQEEPQFSSDDILIGHSLGFLWGMAQFTHWRGWVAINSFACFANGARHRQTEPVAVCASLAEIRAMRRGLSVDPLKIVQDFHARIGSSFLREREALSSMTPQKEALSQTLEFLRLADASHCQNLRAAPGRILASANDPLTPGAATDYLAKQAANADLLWSAEGGHLLPALRPDWCAGAIQNFINERF